MAVHAADTRREMREMSKCGMFASLSVRMLKDDREGGGVCITVGRHSGSMKRKRTGI